VIDHRMVRFVPIVRRILRGRAPRTARRARRMSKVKVAVIYYSSTGTNHRLAQAAAEAAQQAGAEVRLRRVPESVPAEVVDRRPEWRAHVGATRDVPEATHEDLEWADAYVFSTPTRFGNMAAQMKAFIDAQGGLWAQGKLANKPVTVMTSAQNAHGGQETTILSFYIVLSHWGAIIVPPGYTDPSLFVAGGNPYGTSVTATDGSVPEAELTAARHQARRVVEITQYLGAGRDALQQEAEQAAAATPAKEREAYAEQPVPR